MKRNSDIWIWIMVLFTLLAAGCEGDSESDASLKKPSLKMYIYLPEDPVVTRDDPGIDSDRANENRIRTLQVWVFGLDEDKVPVNIAEDGATTNGSLYAELEDVALTGGVKEIAFDVSEGFKESYPYLNVYAIANAASIGHASLDASTTEEELKELKIEGGYFGIDGTTHQPTVATVGDDGLPMSAYLAEAQVWKVNELFTITSMTMMRAVSKIRFVLVKANDIPSATVTAIRLDGHITTNNEGRAVVNNGDGALTIPDTEYLFSGLHQSSGNGDFSNSFAREVVFDVPLEVPSHDNPWILRWDVEESSQEWEDKINDAVSIGLAVECGRAYLRESPQCLTGTISYRYGEEPGTAEISGTARFSMVGPGGFLRNHSWTILALFSEGGVVFEVDDWERQNVTFKPFI